MRVELDNKQLHSNDKIPQSFYDTNQDLAATCIAMNIIKKLCDNNLITKTELLYLQNKK